MSIKFFDFDNYFGPKLAECKLVSDGFFNVDLLRFALSHERSDSHKRFNQLIKEMFSNKEVDNAKTQTPRPKNRP